MVNGSVIIPAFEEAESIKNTLNSLQGQDAEVIVVVDGDDATDEIARNHETVDRVIDGRRKGPGAARNRGVRQSEGDVALFTDADTIVPDDWVANHLRHYEDQQVVGVGGPATSIQDTLKDKLLFKLFSDYWYRVSWPLGFVQQPGFNCSFKKRAFLTEGGFNEQIPFLEDTELSLRMKKYGEIVYDPKTRVATSARREASEGYLSLFLTYTRAYFDYYVRDTELKGDYFEN